MVPARIDFYFDYVSPYAYFGWLHVAELCDRRGLELAIHPVVFAKLLDHWGTVGPAEVPPRRAWVYRDAFRHAARHAIPFVGPKLHPFNPLTALRVSTPEVAGDRQRAVVDVLFRTGWGRGLDYGDPGELAAALIAGGLPGDELIARAHDDAAKRALRDHTDRAIARDVFGVPTMIVGHELFWGSDRVDDLERHLDGADPLDGHRDAVAEIMLRPRGADRRR